MSPNSRIFPELSDIPLRAVVGTRIGSVGFMQLAGILSGHPYVKIVYDNKTKTLHFLNSAIYSLHAMYIAENLLGISAQEMANRIDEFNKQFYFDENRRFYLGILSLIKTNKTGLRKKSSTMVLETVEVDQMSKEMLQEFFDITKKHLDLRFNFYWKPANHFQESMSNEMDLDKYPRILARELYANKNFIALQPGKVKGRIRVFTNESEYKEQRHTILWHDIIVMRRVPDDIPRISGIINAEHTTPLSHTNVLAKGWMIPNCVQIGVLEKIEEKKLNNSWVEYIVLDNVSNIILTPIPTPTEVPVMPAWATNIVKLEEPESETTPIRRLSELRAFDRNRFGTKAANLGELYSLLNDGSSKFLNFYSLPHPPRPNLLSYLENFLGIHNIHSPQKLEFHTQQFLRTNLNLPKGLAVPFSFMREFLESSPQLQQNIGKLKLAIELNIRQVEALSISIQHQIKELDIPDKMRKTINWYIENDLQGINSFVVRSSSNAEDLPGFSAAGVYESVNHVTSKEKILESIKTVWASLFSPRAARLRQEAGISLDDAYMGVIIQEELPANYGGVMVTTNPTNLTDFRNVYLNVSIHSVEDVVHGTEIPMQYLYNAVEGGGRTLSLGNFSQDLSAQDKGVLQILSVLGKLLEAHFAPDAGFNHPVDIEWLVNNNGLYILQLRPFGG